MVDATINMVLAFTSRELVVNHIQDSTGLTCLFDHFAVGGVWVISSVLLLQMTDDE